MLDLTHTYRGGETLIKIALIDDEKSELVHLSRCFDNLQHTYHEEFDLHLFDSGKAFLASFDSSYDLISLDIDMKGRDGIAIAKEIRKVDEEVLILFVTNVGQMAIRGYEVRALDFVIKPVNDYFFSMKIRNALNIIRNRKSQNILIRNGEGLQIISSDDLYFAEVLEHTLYYHTKRGVIQQKASLTGLEEKLQGLAFKRCNNSYLIHLKYVEAVVKNELHIAGSTIKISRPRKKEFLQALANYIGGVRG